MKSSKAPPLKIPPFALGLLAGLSVAALDGVLYGKGRAAARRSARAAASPADMPARDWKSVLKRTVTEFNSDHIPAVAGGATFFALLALFPALGVFVSLYGLFADVEQARLHVLKLQGVLPEGAVSVLSEQMTRLATAPHDKLGLTFAVSFLLSIWSSNAGMKSIIAGLNVAYEEKETRNFFRLNAVSLTFTVGAVGLAILAAAIPGWMKAAGVPHLLVLDVLRWPLLLALVGALLSVLYRYAPCRRRAQWRWITPGGAFAALAWLGMSLGFSLYVANFGHYDKTYGSLGAIVGFMTWIWLSMTVVLLGAELNSELEQHTSVDTTAGAPMPAGQRGAAVADGRKRSA